MIDFKLEIAKKIAKLIDVNEKEIVQYIEIPPNSEMGDYAFPCFKLAKILKKPPIQIAEELKEKMELDEIINRVENVSGYLNFYINQNSFIKQTLEKIVLNKENYGSLNIGSGKNVVIEYSSPNIAKPFHVGHLRTTIIGSSLYRIYSFLGYTPIGINYLGDYGTQFGKVIAGYKKWDNEYNFSKDIVKSLVDIYVRYNAAEKEDESLTEEARLWFKKLEDGDEEASSLWEWIRAESLKEYNKIYDLLGCKFDSYNGEAFYAKLTNETVKELEEKKLLTTSQGAKVVDLEKYNMPPCIILKSNGTTIYATRDVASLLYRIRNYNFDKAIYVVGGEQKLHFQQIFKVVELMGYEQYAKNCVHVPFGLICGKDGKKLATRKGDLITLEEILDEAIDKAKQIIEEKNPELTDKNETAKKIGIGAIIFNDLANNRIKDEIFDWDSVLNFNGETGPYVQYIYVRTRSLLRKANIEDTHFDSKENISYSLIKEKEEIETVKLLANFENIVIDAAEKFEPSIISRYLISLAQSFSRLYNNHHILCDDEKLKIARLALTYAVGITIKIGLALLGIQCPEEM